MGSLWTADRRYWLTADRKRVVPDGDPDSAFLYAAPGQRVSLAEATRHGLVKAETEEKAMPAPANKIAKPKANKGA